MTPERWEQRLRNIGGNIRFRRAKRSQESLAHAIGISKLTVSRIELGKGGTTIKTLLLLADEFNVPPHYLLMNIDRSTPNEIGSQ